MNTFLKSAGAIVVGFITVAGLSTVTDFLLEAIGVLPPVSQEGLFVTWMLMLALSYRLVYTVLGGYVTARLAPESPMKHVWILAGIGQVAGILGVVAGWNLSAHWYPIAIALTAIPCTWLGGWLRTRRSV
jgi:hypothetical protein